MKIAAMLKNTMTPTTPREMINVESVEEDEVCMI
jgi:hypothetical protein